MTLENILYLAVSHFASLSLRVTHAALLMPCFFFFFDRAAAVTCDFFKPNRRSLFLA